MPNKAMGNSGLYGRKSKGASTMKKSKGGKRKGR